MNARKAGSVTSRRNFTLSWGLVIEKLPTTHDEKKLRMFGDALANCGLSSFEMDDKEDFIRILRDLSAKDLQVLNHELLTGWTPHVTQIKYGAEILCSLARLEGMG